MLCVCVKKKKSAFEHRLTHNCLQQGGNCQVRLPVKSHLNLLGVEQQTRVWQKNGFFSGKKWGQERCSKKKMSRMQTRTCEEAEHSVSKWKSLTWWKHTVQSPTKNWRRKKDNPPACGVSPWVAALAPGAHGSDMMTAGLSRSENWLDG